MMFKRLSSVALCLMLSSAIRPSSELFPRSARPCKSIATDRVLEYINATSPIVWKTTPASTSRSMQLEMTVVDMATFRTAEAYLAGLPNEAAHSPSECVWPPDGRFFDTTRCLSTGHWVSYDQLEQYLLQIWDILKRLSPQNGVVVLWRAKKDAKDASGNDVVLRWKAAINCWTDDIGTHDFMREAVYQKKCRGEKPDTQGVTMIEWLSEVLLHQWTFEPLPV